MSMSSRDVGEIAEGHGRTLKALFHQAAHRAIPGAADRGLPALPGAPRAAALRERPGTLHRLLSVRGGLPDRAPSTSRRRRMIRHNPVSPGERYARVYEVNLMRCVFCGDCETACPVEAIVLGHDFELAVYNRDGFLLDERGVAESGRAERDCAGGIRPLIRDLAHLRLKPRRGMLSCSSSSPDRHRRRGWA